MSLATEQGLSRKCEDSPVEAYPDIRNACSKTPENLTVVHDYEISKWECEEASDGAQTSMENQLPIRKIFVGNLTERTNQRDLRNLFGRYGEIIDCHRSRDRVTGFRHSYAFVTYKNPEDAAKVLNAPHAELNLHSKDLRVAAANAQHQPQELEDGRVLWRRKHAKTLNNSSKDAKKLSISYELCEARLRSVKEVDEKLCQIHVLNDDCLLRVFSFLSKVERIKIERVCKRWQAVSRSTWLYVKHLDFSFMSSTRDGIFPKADILQGLLVRCGPNLQSLDLSYSPNKFNNRVLVLVSKLSPNLCYLNVSGLALATHSMRRLSEVAHQLRRLNFDGCSGLLERDLRSLFQNCPNLESLVLSSNNQLTGKCLAELQNEKFSELVLDNCNNLRSRFLAINLQRLKNLTYLSVNSCVNLTSSDIIEILESLPQLKNFSIGGYFPLLSVTALNSLEHLSDLVTLNLEHNPSVIDGVMEAVSLNCLKLEKLNVTGCIAQNSSLGDRSLFTNHGFRFIARLPRLVDLKMSYLSAVVTDEALDAVADRGKLRKLECRGCPTFTDAGCMRVIALCADLEYFDFSGCDHVSNQTIETALEAVKERTNNLPLKIIAGGTNVGNVTADHPLLQVDLRDLCVTRMRSDFVDELYYNSTDDDDDDDDHDDLYFDDDGDGNIDGIFMGFDDSQSDLEYDRYSFCSYDGYDYLGDLCS